MGSSTSKRPVELARCAIPTYCLKVVGSRHLLVGGGGGDLKGGLANEIQLYLLAYNQLGTHPALTITEGVRELGAKKTGVLNTDTYASMNMDVVAVEQQSSGKYLVAVGQDQYCALYQSTGYALQKDAAVEGDEGAEQDLAAGTEDDGPQLALRLEPVGRFVTDHHSKEPYQNCVKFFHSAEGEHRLLIATGGTDGHVRVWSVDDLLLEFNAEQQSGLDSSAAFVEEHDGEAPEPLIEFQAGLGPIDEMDVSACGEVIAVVAGKEAGIWRTTNGQRAVAVGNPPQLNTSEYSIRSLKFLHLDKSGRNAIFLAGYNKRMKTGKQMSHVALWAFAKQQKECHLISTKVACQEPIACMSVSECSNYAAVGTREGSVAIYNVHDMTRPLLVHQGAHSLFVTAMEFLPHRTYDATELAGGRVDSTGGEGGGSGRENKARARCFLPGVCFDSRCAVVSVGVDKSIQLHKLPFPKPPSVTGTMVKLAASSLLFYFLLWLLFGSGQWA